MRNDGACGRDEIGVHKGLLLAIEEDREVHSTLLSSAK